MSGKCLVCNRIRDRTAEGKHALGDAAQGHTHAAIGVPTPGEFAKPHGIPGPMDQAWALLDRGLQDIPELVDHHDYVVAELTFEPPQHCVAPRISSHTGRPHRLG